MKEIGRKYSCGELLTGEVKKILIGVLTVRSRVHGTPIKYFFSSFFSLWFLFYFFCILTLLFLIFSSLSHFSISPQFLIRHFPHNFLIRLWLVSTKREETLSQKKSSKNTLKWDPWISKSIHWILKGIQWFQIIPLVLEMNSLALQRSTGILK